MTKRLFAATALVVLGIAGWAQDTGSTSLSFTTRSGVKVPVYELTAAAGEPTPGYLRLNAASPTFVAPLVLDVENGRHWYQLGASSLFPTRFDLLADGAPQSWRLDAGNPTLHTVGWIALVTGLLVAAIGVNDWQASSPVLFKSPDAPFVELAGVAIGGGGLALMLSTRPSASRAK